MLSGREERHTLSPVNHGDTSQSLVTMGPCIQKRVNSTLATCECRPATSSSLKKCSCFRVLHQPWLLAGAG